MDKKTKQKTAIIFGAVVLLYVLSTGPGMRCDNGNMETAMQEVSRLVADARAEIKKEMEKPFLLRLFGSLFGMEGNKFEKLKKRLPPIIEAAMPGYLRKRSTGASAATYSCKGMRLPDALRYCLENRLTPERFAWRFDTTVHEGRYLNPACSILDSDFSGKQPSKLTLQFNHGFNDGDGIGNGGKRAVDSLAVLAQKAIDQPSRLGTWIAGLVFEDSVRNMLTGLNRSSLLDSTVAYDGTLRLPEIGK